MKFKLILLILLPIIAFGQNMRDSSMYTPLFNLSYSYQIPGGDLSERFGANSNLGLSGGFKTSSNWQFELEGTFMFGRLVNESTMLDNLKTEEGYIIDQYGDFATILVYQRGFTSTLNIGKIFTVIGPNPNSGIIAKFGIGMMQHKIRYDVKENLVPSLYKDKLPYYDRLTIGLVLKQYIGYQHISSNRLANFNIGIEINEGFTQGMRDYQIDLEGPYRENRTDFLFGIRAGWVIPIYRKAPKEYYYN